MFGVIFVLLAWMPGRGATASPAAGGDQLWVARFDSPAHDDDFFSGMEISPDGTRLFVTGTSYGVRSSDYVTVAYDTSSGRAQWAARYGGNGLDSADAIAVSPDGRRVFVTGWQGGSGGLSDYGTVAYDAETGSQLWEAVYAGDSIDGGRDIAVSPDGGTVIVTGFNSGVYGTIAYEAATGLVKWVRKRGSNHGSSDALALAISPDGSTVFVTGRRRGGTTNDDYYTLAYEVSTGTPRWQAQYDGRGHGEDWATAIAVSADGSKVFVTGHSDGGSTGLDCATLAYDAMTGSPLWKSRYEGANDDEGKAVAVDSDGSKVFVTGWTYVTQGTDTGWDYATIAYDTGSGSVLWKRRFNGPRNDTDTVEAMAASPDGSKVFVAGQSFESQYDSAYATIAYQADTGSVLWAARYDAAAGSYESAWGIVASPDSAGVFVSGSSVGIGTSDDYATVAYTA
jgi:WD40 repeat protein